MHLFLCRAAIRFQGWSEIFEILPIHVSARVGSQKWFDTSLKTEGESLRFYETFNARHSQTCILSTQTLGTMKFIAQQPLRQTLKQRYRVPTQGYFWDASGHLINNSKESF
jgi:hypothetical protein